MAEIDDPLLLLRFLTPNSRTHDRLHASGVAIRVSVETQWLASTSQCKGVNSLGCR